MGSSIEDKRVAIYIRVSTHWQVDKDSLPVQRSELINYSKFVLGIHDYVVFEDAGYSAKNTDRPAYQQMIARVRTGEFSHVLVWKLDRISRNLLDFAAMYAELKRIGVVFISKNEQFDTSSAMGEAMLKIILVFAELERQMTSERVSAVMLSRAGNGQWNGGKVPFGYSYSKENEEFKINEDEAEIVRRIYSSYIEERSLLSVSKSLNADGILTREKHIWSPVSVSIILKSPFYIGVYRYNYRDESKGKHDWTFKDEDEWILIEGHHPPIISAETYDKVKEILADNQRLVLEHHVPRNSKNTNIFSGLLTCSICGSIMVASPGKTRKDGYSPSSYNCPSRRKIDKCTNKYVSDKTLGPFFLNYISNIIKASNSFGKSTTPETLEKKLLRGPYFKDIDHIEYAGLMELYEHLQSGFSDHPFAPPQSIESTDTKERDLLIAQKHQKERALSRLKSIYLYSEDSMSESEYYIDRKRIQDDLDNTNKRLSEIDASIASNSPLSDDEFMDKASYFLITQGLQDKRTVDFGNFMKTVSPKILKIFVQNVVKNFCIKDGLIESITFKNGISHQFIYKDSKTPDA